MQDLCLQYSLFSLFLYIVFKLFALFVYIIKSYFDLSTFSLPLTLTPGALQRERLTLSLFLASRCPKHFTTTSHSPIHTPMGACCQAHGGLLRSQESKRRCSDHRTVRSTTCVWSSSVPCRELQGQLSLRNHSANRQKH